MTTFPYQVRPSAVRGPDGTLIDCSGAPQVHTAATMRDAAEAWARDGYPPTPTERPANGLPGAPLRLHLAAMTLLPTVGFFEFTTPDLDDWTVQVTVRDADPATG